jgi:hypothetical protein
MKHLPKMIVYLAVASLLLQLLFVSPKGALADDRPIRPEIGPYTQELLPYQSPGYRYLVLGPNMSPPEDWEQPFYDTDPWSEGNAAFGSPQGSCPLRANIQTNTWTTGTATMPSQLLVRRRFTVPEGATNIRAMVSVDNDVLGVFIDGTLVYESNFIRNEKCPIRDEWRIPISIPIGPVGPGKHLVAFHLQDRGYESFFDTRILADIVPISEPCSKEGECPESPSTVPDKVDDKADSESPGECPVSPGGVDSKLYADSAKSEEEAHNQINFQAENICTGMCESAGREARCVPLVPPATAKIEELVCEPYEEGVWKCTATLTACSCNWSK